MEYKHVYNCGRECRKSNSISHCKHCTEVKRTFAFISCRIKVEIRVDDTRNIVSLAGGGEEVIGKYRKGFGSIKIQPVANGYYNIHNQEESNSNIGSSKPWAC